MARKKVVRVEKGPKDDGSLWIIVDANGRQVYQGNGIRKSEAERLANGLVQSATIEMVTPPTEV